MGQADPGATSPATWPEGQSQISPWLPKSRLTAEFSDSLLCLSPSPELSPPPPLTLTLSFSPLCPREVCGFFFLIMELF